MQRATLLFQLLVEIVEEDDAIPADGDDVATLGVGIDPLVEY